MTTEEALKLLREWFPSATVGVEQFSIAPDRRFFYVRVAGRVKGAAPILSDAMAQARTFYRELNSTVPASTTKAEGR